MEGQKIQNEFNKVKNVDNVNTNKIYSLNKKYTQNTDNIHVKIFDNNDFINNVVYVSDLMDQFKKDLHRRYAIKINNKQLSTNKGEVCHNIIDNIKNTYKTELTILNKQIPLSTLIFGVCSQSSINYFNTHFFTLEYNKESYLNMLCSDYFNINVDIKDNEYVFTIKFYMCLIRISDDRDKSTYNPDTDLPYYCEIFLKYKNETLSIFALCRPIKKIPKTPTIKLNCTNKDTGSFFERVHKKYIDYSKRRSAIKSSRETETRAAIQSKYQKEHAKLTYLENNYKGSDKDKVIKKQSHIVNKLLQNNLYKGII